MPRRDLNAEAVVNLTMRGYGAMRIARHLGITLSEAKALIRRELAVPPSQISPMFRSPTINAEPDEETVERMIDDYNAGLTIKDVAARYEVAPGTVNSALRKRNVPIRRHMSPWSLDEYDYLLKHVNDPWTDTARHLGRSRAQVKHRYRLLRDAGFPIPRKRGRPCLENSSIAS